MRHLLREFRPSAINKLHCFSVDISTVDPSESLNYGGYGDSQYASNYKDASNFAETANAVGTWGAVLAGMFSGSTVNKTAGGLSITPRPNAQQLSTAAKSQQTTLIIILLVVGGLFIVAGRA